MDLPCFLQNPTGLPRRSRPAEFCRYDSQWHQDGDIRRGVRRRGGPYYHFVWPKDGRRGSTMGRFKDILQGKGPDMFVTISADKEDYMANRPTRAEWGNWQHLDDRHNRNFPNAWWTDSHRECKKYDCRKRKYRHYRPNMWTDAMWYPGADRRNDAYPRAMRDTKGEWYEDIHPEQLEQWWW